MPEGFHAEVVPPTAEILALMTKLIEQNGQLLAVNLQLLEKFAKVVEQSGISYLWNQPTNPLCKSAGESIVEKFGTVERRKKAESSPSEPQVVGVNITDEPEQSLSMAEILEFARQERDKFVAEQSRVEAAPQSSAPTTAETAPVKEETDRPAAKNPGTANQRMESSRCHVEHETPRVFVKYDSDR